MHQDPRLQLLQVCFRFWFLLNMTGFLRRCHVLRLLQGLCVLFRQSESRSHLPFWILPEHIYEEIQSYLEETKIENILARAVAGDPDALNVRQGQYADITQFPTNLAEAQKTILKLGSEFEKLPNEIREKFDFSKEKFIQQFGSEDWVEKMGFKAAEKAPDQQVMQANTEVLTPEVE